MEKKELGIKVKGFTAGIITGVVWCVLLFIAFLFCFIFVEQHIFFFISVLGCLVGSIAMICVLDKVLRQPKVMLEYDDTYLYFNEYQKTTKIPINEIVSVEPFKHFDKHHTYEFGDIKIVKMDGSIYEIGKIYYVDNVCDTILTLMGKK